MLTPHMRRGTSTTKGGRRQEQQRRKVRRALYSIVGVVLVLAVGTVGFHLVGGMGWVDAFYFESMLATGQGPPVALTTDASKLFASVMAFVSVGSVVAALAVALGPVISQAWREGVAKAETDVRSVERDLAERKAGEGGDDHAGA